MAQYSAVVRIPETAVAETDGASEPGGRGLHRKWKIEKQRLFVLLICITAFLFVLAIASVAAEISTEIRVCRETTAADQYCGRTKYAGFWGGALFAIVIASFTIKLLFTSDNFHWRLWLKFNEGIAVIALLAFGAMLGLNVYEALSEYTKLMERVTNAEAEAMLTNYSDCENSLIRERVGYLKAGLVDIEFFIGCTWKVCVAVALTLLVLPHVFLPALLRAAKCALGSIPHLAPSLEEATIPLQSRSAVEVKDVSIQSEPAIEKSPSSIKLITVSNEAALIESKPEASLVLHIIEDDQNSSHQASAYTPLPQPATSGSAVNNDLVDEDARKLLVVSSLYELAYKHAFCTTLEEVFNVAFESNTAYDPQMPNSLITITCKHKLFASGYSNSGRASNSDGALKMGKPDDILALNALQRFIERCVQPSTTKLTLRFPIILRDELGDAAIKYIRSAIDEALGGEGIRYAQLAVDKSAGEVGVLCSIEADGRGASGSGHGSRTKTEVSNEVEAEKRKSKALAAAEYAAHRRLRRVVEEVDELEKAFETREDVKVFRVVGGEHQNLRVFVYRGESWRVPGDFVVNGVNGSLEQAEGQTRQQGPGSGSGSGSGSGTEGKSDIESAAGGELRSELERVMRERRGRKLAVGEVVSTRAYRLAAGRILHVNVGGASSSSSSSGSAPGRREATAEEQRIELQQVYGAVFNAAAAEAPAEANDIRIALSLLGSEAAAATTTTTVTATTTGGRGRQGVDKVDESVEALLDVLTNGAGGALERFREVHIVEKEGEKTRKLEERAGSKELELRFARERSGAKVRLVKPGFQPFAYADEVDARARNVGDNLSAAAQSLSTFTSPGGSTLSLGVAQGIAAGRSLEQVSETDTDAVSATESTFVEP